MKAFPLAQDVLRLSSRSRWTLLLGSVFMALLTVLGAMVSVPLPFSPVPITMQTLAVTLAGVTLGPVWGPVSQLLYVGAGIAGLPVFAGGGAGVGVLLGPTGGYLVGFVIGAWLAGLLARPGGPWVSLVAASLAAHGAVFLFGISHLALFTGNDLPQAIRIGLVPFLPGTALKTVTAVLLLRSSRLTGWLRP